MAENVIDIDGGVMEGGGQILRMSVAFSVLLQKSIHVHNIRAGRKNPGLRPQHLAGLQLVADLCDGKLIGGKVGSTEITFHPGNIKSGEFSADPGTAGSVTLLFQVAFPCMIFAPGTTYLYLKGGTNVEMAPQMEYTLEVLKPIVEKFGAVFECDFIKGGYYPKGGGEVVITSQPVKGSLKAIEILDCGSISRFSGLSFVAGVLPIKMAHIMADNAVNVLRKDYPSVPLSIERVKYPSHQAFGNGSGVIIKAHTSTNCVLGGSALGKRDIRAEQVGESAAVELLQDVKTGACVDHFLQDQLIIFMALAKGQSRIQCGKITLHTETGIYIAEKLAKVKFNIEKGSSDADNVIECHGIGLSK